MTQRAGAEDVLADLRHDVRSPLAVIIGYADLLAGRDLTDAVRRQYAGRIGAAAIEIRDLIDETRV